MESILTSIKQMLGITAEYTQFDNELIMHINSAFLSLTQLGVGPAEGFMITGADETWGDFIEDNIQLQAAKTCMYLKVKLVFDPPLSSSLEASMTRQIAEFEWRLNAAVE